MARKTRKNSTTSKAPMTDIEELMISCPGLSVADADAMLAKTRQRKPAGVRDLKTGKPLGTPAETLKWKPVESLVFPKPAKRVTKADTDFTNRLSSSATDSDAMKEFMANGGTITVLPTRNSKGFKRSKVRVSAGSSRLTVAKTRAAHDKVVRDIKHDAILASTKRRS